MSDFPESAISRSDAPPGTEWTEFPLDFLGMSNLSGEVYPNFGEIESSAVQSLPIQSRYNLVGPSPYTDLHGPLDWPPRVDLPQSANKLHDICGGEFMPGGDFNVLSGEFQRLSQHVDSMPGYRQPDIEEKSAALWGHEIFRHLDGAEGRLDSHSEEQITQELLSFPLTPQNNNLVSYNEVDLVNDLLRMARDGSDTLSGLLSIQCGSEPLPQSDYFDGPFMRDCSGSSRLSDNHTGPNTTSDSLVNGSETPGELGELAWFNNRQQMVDLGTERTMESAGAITKEGSGSVGPSLGVSTSGQSPHGEGKKTAKVSVSNQRKRSRVDEAPTDRMGSDSLSLQAESTSLTDESPSHTPRVRKVFRRDREAALPCATDLSITTMGSSRLIAALARIQGPDVSLGLIETKKFVRVLRQCERPSDGCRLSKPTLVQASSIILRRLNDKQVTICQYCLPQTAEPSNPTTTLNGKPYKAAKTAPWIWKTPDEPQAEVVMICLFEYEKQISEDPDTDEVPHLALQTLNSKYGVRCSSAWAHCSDSTPRVYFSQNGLANALQTRAARSKSHAAVLTSDGGPSNDRSN